MTGAETELFRLIANGAHIKFVTDLDLWKAYDTVHRKSIMSLATKLLPQNFANMIAGMLQPITVKTSGDQTDATAVISTGVPQTPR